MADLPIISSTPNDILTTSALAPPSTETSEPAASLPESSESLSISSPPPPPQPPMPEPPEPKTKSGKRQGIILATLLLLLLTLPLAVYFIAQQRQLADIRNRAAIIGGGYPSPSSGPPLVTLIATPTPTPSTRPTECAIGASSCLFLSEGAPCTRTGGGNGVCHGQLTSNFQLQCQCVAPTITLTPTPTPIAGPPGCCYNDSQCPKDWSCRISNGACTGSGFSCGKINCFPNGQACAENNECCSGGCDLTKHVCFGGNRPSTCPRPASVVCTDENGTVGGGMTCSGSGVSCKFGNTPYCCYGDASSSCPANGGPGPDGGCYGAGGLTCGGGSITNTTQATLTVNRYEGKPGEVCPPTGAGMSKFVGSEPLPPGGSASINGCEQIDVPGYACGQCKNGCATLGGGTTAPTNPPPTTPPGAPACQQVKVYKAGTTLTTAQLPSLKPGDAITIAVLGTSSITKAHIRVNSGSGWSNWTEITTKNASGEYSLPFTIPANATTMSIEAEVFQNNQWY